MCIVVVFIKTERLRGELGYAFLFLCTVYTILSGTRFAGHLGFGVVGFVLLAVFLAFL